MTTHLDEAEEWLKTGEAGCEAAAIERIIHYLRALAEPPKANELHFCDYDRASNICTGDYCPGHTVEAWDEHDRNAVPPTSEPIIYADKNVVVRESLGEATQVEPSGSGLPDVLPGPRCSYHCTICGVIDWPCEHFRLPRSPTLPKPAEGKGENATSDDLDEGAGALYEFMQKRSGDPPGVGWGQATLWHQLTGPLREECLDAYRFVRDRERASTPAPAHQPAVTEGEGPSDDYEGARAMYEHAGPVSAWNNPWDKMQPAHREAYVRAYRFAFERGLTAASSSASPLNPAAHPER